MIRTIYESTANKLVETLNKKDIHKEDIINITKMNDQFVCFYDRGF